MEVRGERPCPITVGVPLPHAREDVGYVRDALLRDLEWLATFDAVEHPFADPLPYRWLRYVQVARGVLGSQPDRDFKRLAKAAEMLDDGVDRPQRLVAI